MKWKTAQQIERQNMHKKENEKKKKKKTGFNPGKQKYVFWLNIQRWYFPFAGAQQLFDLDHL